MIVFYGMLYSDLYNRDVFLNQLSRNSTNAKEILLHPVEQPQKRMNSSRINFISFTLLIIEIRSLELPFL